MTLSCGDVYRIIPQVRRVRSRPEDDEAGGPGEAARRLRDASRRPRRPRPPEVTRTPRPRVPKTVRQTRAPTPAGSRRSPAAGSEAARPESSAVPGTARRDRPARSAPGPRSASAARYERRRDAAVHAAGPAPEDRLARRAPALIVMLVRPQPGDRRYSPLLALRDHPGRRHGPRWMPRAARRGGRRVSWGCRSRCSDEDRASATSSASSRLIRSCTTELVPPGTLIIHVVERTPIGDRAAARSFDRHRSGRGRHRASATRAHAGAARHHGRRRRCRGPRASGRWREVLLALPARVPGSGGRESRRAPATTSRLVLHGTRISGWCGGAPRVRSSRRASSAALARASTGARPGELRRVGAGQRGLPRGLSAAPFRDTRGVGVPG